ncbi:MAG: hypothetical protein V4613_11625 [Bacteroidota bacterium]
MPWIKSRQVIILLLMFGVACTSNTPETIEKNGVTFIIPNGWKITHESVSPNNVTSLTCEKSGVDESGIAVIAIFDQTYDPLDVLANSREMMQQNPVYAQAGIQFANFKGELFQQQQVMAMPFSFTDKSSTQNGKVVVFTLCNKTISVLMQQDKIDSTRNAKGFEAMSNAFSCSK